MHINTITQAKYTLRATKFGSTTKALTSVTCRKRDKCNKLAHMFIDFTHKLDDVFQVSVSSLVLSSLLKAMFVL